MLKNVLLTHFKNVIPAQAGTQLTLCLGAIKLVSRFRGNDGLRGADVTKKDFR
jgi:hypothetical protein